MLFNRKGLRISQYWALVSRPHEDDFLTTVSKVRELLEDAGERQLVSDVPICTFLSGGLDSSALTALGVKHNLKKGLSQLHTYSIDFIDNEKFFKPTKFQPNSDNVWVGKMVNYLGTEHHYISFDTPHLVEALDKAVWARDLPGMADIDSSLYLFCREVKKGATVALSGECADEVFGGYPWFYQEDILALNNFPWLRAVKERSKIISPNLLAMFDPEEYSRERYQETLKEVPVLAGESKWEIKRREMFYLNFTWFMATLLDRKDRMSMATGLEVRVPFCDHRIVEYVWNIPWKMKYYQEREKGLLRYALKGLLPDDVLWRKKSPYPKTHNPSYLQAVRNRLLKIINNPNSPLLDLINVSYIRELLYSDLTSFNRPWFGQLMTGPQLFAFLIQVDIWLRMYRVSIK